jgi:hypothetical protein
MGKHKNEIDELIREALGEEEANYYEKNNPFCRKALGSTRVNEHGSQSGLAL